jgi:hypothetical protein
MTTLSISVKDEVAKEAKERLRGRISAICEEALRKKLMISDEDKVKKCYYCDKSEDEMIWDGILEVWVCKEHNKAQIRSNNSYMRK